MKIFRHEVLQLSADDTKILTQNPGENVNAMETFLRLFTTILSRTINSNENSKNFFFPDFQTMSKR